MKYTLLFSQLVVTGVFLTLNSQAITSASHHSKSNYLCNVRPDFVNQNRIEVAKKITDLPDGLYLAKESEHYVERINSNGTIKKFYGRHNMDKKSESVLMKCDLDLKDKNFRFQLSAPTVIDKTAAKKIGNTVWNFQLYSNSNQLKSWNVKSPLASVNTNLDKMLANNSAVYKIFQINEKEYEVVLSKKIDTQTTQYLSVKYAVY